MSKQVGLDHEAMYEFGRNLWQMRHEKHLTLYQLSRRVNIPENIIDRMEIGKFVQYGALRRLMEYYGKKARIVFEDLSY